MNTTRPLLLAVCVVLGLAACGRGGAQVDASDTTSPGGVDKAALTKLAGDVSIDRTPATTCGTLLAASFVSTVYGTAANCAQAQDTDPSDVPNGAAVESISVKGDSATAKVTQQFGPNTIGASGTWEFTRSATAWQVSGWDVDYLRSYIDTVFGANYQSGDPSNDPIADATYRGCIDSTLQALDDTTLRTVAYGLLSDRNTRLGQAVVGCDAKAPGGRSPFWTVLESGIKSGAGTGTLAGRIANCMIAGMHAKYSDAQIIDVTLSGNGKTDLKAFNKALGTIGTKCGNSVAVQLSGGKKSK